MIDRLQQVDAISGWTFLIVVAALLLAFEAGRHLGGRTRSTGTARAQHAANVLSGMLTLLAFLLAFGFGIAESHFSARRQLVLDEANAIGTTYLRSKYLPQPEGLRVQRLLLEYVDQRIVGDDAVAVAKARARSEALHAALWEVVVSLEKRNPDSEFAGLFVASLNQMIDLHQSRVTTTKEFRLPVIILVSLYVNALLTLLVMGYSAGLAGTGDALSTFAVVAAVAVVLVLVMDLNRPVQRTFAVSQAALKDVRASLKADLARLAE